MSEDRKRFSPASERNQGPILVQLQRLLPLSGVMLEIASGTGQHAAHFSKALPSWTWQPSDVSTEAFDSIGAWCQGLRGVRPPLVLDVRQPHWAGAPTPVDAIFCANMLHIAPWDCCAGLMQGASRHLAPHGRLLTYGPYFEEEVPTAESNLAFDADLRTRNPEWGLRHRSEVERVAGEAGLALQQRVEMPANNLLLVWGHDGRVKGTQA